MPQQELNQQPKCLWGSYGQFKLSYSSYHFLAKEHDSDNRRTGIIMRTIWWWRKLTKSWWGDTKTHLQTHSVLLFFCCNIHNSRLPKNRHTPPHILLLSPLRGLAQAAWQLLSVYVLVFKLSMIGRRPSPQSCELRAWINIRWAQHRQKERQRGGDSLHISNTHVTSNSSARSSTSCLKTVMLRGDAAAIQGSSSSSVDKTTVKSGGRFG